jgi:hypothetical protein
MNDESLLTLHCPQCKQIEEVVTEGNNLVCLSCGWKFDEKTVARFLNQIPSPPKQTAPADAVRQ